MSRILRVAAIQLCSGIDAAANRAAAEPLIRAAASAGAQLIATPENSMRMDRDRARLLAASTPAHNESELEAWGALAKDIGAWLLLGSGSVAGQAKVFNRSYLFSPAGVSLAHYDKIHLFDVELGNGESYRESAGVHPGDRAVVVEGPLDTKIGLSICYDLRFAPLYSSLAKAGAEVIVIPAAFTHTTGQAHWEVLVRARAIETGAYVIAPAQGGVHEDGRRTFGNSLVVDPWGVVMGSIPNESPGYVVVDLDLDRVAEVRAKIPAWRGGPFFTVPQ